jgi:hypothetical protein
MDLQVLRDGDICEAVANLRFKWRGGARGHPESTSARQIFDPDKLYSRVLIARMTNPDRAAWDRRPPRKSPS